MHARRSRRTSGPWFSATMFGVRPRAEHRGRPPSTKSVLVLDLEQCGPRARTDLARGRILQVHAGPAAHRAAEGARARPRSRPCRRRAPDRRASGGWRARPPPFHRSSGRAMSPAMKGSRRVRTAPAAPRSVGVREAQCGLLGTVAGSGNARTPIRRARAPSPSSTGPCSSVPRARLAVDVDRRTGSRRPTGRARSVVRVAVRLEDVLDERRRGSGANGSTRRCRAEGRRRPHRRRRSSPIRVARRSRGRHSRPADGRSPGRTLQAQARRLVLGFSARPRAPCHVPRSRQRQRGATKSRNSG